MTRRARLAVRLMDRTRTIEALEMIVVEDDMVSLVLQASRSATTLAEKVGEGPASCDVAEAAVALAREHAATQGSCIGTRLLVDSWLLLVRVDQRNEGLNADDSVYGEPAGDGVCVKCGRGTLTTKAVAVSTPLTKAA